MRVYRRGTLGCRAWRSTGSRAQFTSRPIASGAVQSILALPAESREDVDRLADAAVKAGGSEPRPWQDMGRLNNRAGDDPDGHSWEFLSFDASAVPDTPQ